MGVEGLALWLRAEERQQKGDEEEEEEDVRQFGREQP